ncbi:MAG: ATP synthase F1 subunit delta [Cytophagales bacterium]|nr:ATP synthase F1 subunit delta [Cytophagales bacterium]
MSVGRIANRYARPLLELAGETKVLEQVKEDMDGFSSLCQENREFLLMLRSPIIPRLKKAEILKDIFNGKANKLTMSAFDIITRKNRENLLPEISSEFVRLYNEKMGYQEAVVTTTFPIDDQLRESFQKIVKDVTGSEAVLNETVDKTILGGYILKMGDKQLDESINSHLNEIKSKFTKN